MKKVILIVIGIFVVIQFFTIDKTNPTSDPQQDFIAITNPPVEIGSMIKSSCYDCHSYETVYPWYVQFAPVSWFMKHHIDEGRHHVNFSTWGDYPDNKKSHKLEECIEMINEGEMPLSSYVLMHYEAKWTDEEKSKVLQFFKSQMDK